MFAYTLILDLLGLGASTFNEDNWIAHQDDFSALLSKLNQTGSKGDHLNLILSLDMSLSFWLKHVVFVEIYLSIFT